MAVTGRGDFPLLSPWLMRRRTRKAGAFPLLYSFTQNQLEAPWTDWAFNESPGVGAALTSSTGSFTLSSDVDVVVGAALTASTGDFTLSSDVDVVVGAALTASTGEFTLNSNVDVVIGATSSNNIGNFTLVSDAGIVVGGALTNSIGEFQLITTEVDSGLTSNIGGFTLTSRTEVTTGAPPTTAKPPTRPLYLNRYGRLVDPSARKYALLNRTT